jgi:hypothetical protein
MLDTEHSALQAKMVRVLAGVMRKASVAEKSVRPQKRTVRKRPKNQPEKRVQKRRSAGQSRESKPRRVNQRSRLTRFAAYPRRRLTTALD